MTASNRTAATGVPTRLSTIYLDRRGREHAAPIPTDGEEFSVDILARYLTAPALHGEFHPGVPWEGWSVRRDRPTPIPTSRMELLALFDEQVRGLIDGHEVVGIRFSGGMDSAAVACAVERTRHRSQRVVLVVTQAQTDAGLSVASLARAMHRATCPHASLTKLEAIRESRPPWYTTGPLLEAAPGRNAAAREAAEQAGATILLSGDGADELLTTPAFLAPLLYRHQGAASTARYLTDHDPSDLITTGLVGLAAAVTSSRPRAAAGIYTALTSTAATQGEAALAERVAPQALAWARDYEEQEALEITRLLSDGEPGGWARLEAHFAMWPHDRLPTGVGVPLVSPFLEAPFVQHGLGLPLVQRWDSAARTPYLRRKAAVAALLSEEARCALPNRKQLFSSNLASTVHASALPHLVDIGLLRADAYLSDTAATLTARALELWVRAALDRGYRPG